MESLHLNAICWLMLGLYARGAISNLSRPLALESKRYIKLFGKLLSFRFKLKGRVGWKYFHLSFVHRVTAARFCP